MVCVFVILRMTRETHPAIENSTVSVHVSVLHRAVYLYRFQGKESVVSLINIAYTLLLW